MRSLTAQEVGTLDLLAYLYLRYGHAGRARIYLELLVRLRPESARLHRSYATALLMDGAPREALEAASLSLELAQSSSDRAIAHLILCFAFHRLGRFSEAEASTDQFILERQNTDSLL